MIHIKHEDLNKAKQKVLYLLNLKYKDELMTDYGDETTNTSVESNFDNIVSLLKQNAEHFFQITTMVKAVKEVIGMRNVEVYDRHRSGALKGQIKLDALGNPRMKTIQERIMGITDRYYRNITGYYTFNQHIYNILKNLQSINRIFQSIINNVDFVEPEDMQIFREVYDEYLKYFEDANDIVYDGTELKVTFKDGSNEIDKQNLINAYRNIMNESNTLDKFVNRVNQNYNYTAKNISTNKKGKKFIEDKKASEMVFIDDDDENNV